MFKESVLKLSCAGEADKRSILARLNPSERKLVESALKEIERLGLNKSPSVVDSFLRERQITKETRILPSELKGIDDIESLHPFWQRMLIGCLELPERMPVKRKYGLSANLESAINNIPAGLKRSFIEALKAQKAEKLS